MRPGGASAAAVTEMIRAGDVSGAARAAARLIEAGCGRPVTSVELTLDEYSLNSVSGRVRFGGSDVEFFKFHTEEGEERTVTEYYRARLLADAGLPVEVPLHVVSEPGRQLVLYELRREPRLADVCVARERADGTQARLGRGLAPARRALDAAIGSVLVKTLRAGTGSSATAAIHQLFHHRLAGAAGTFPGGRYQAWYAGDPAFERVAGRRFRVNGVSYASTPRQLAAQAASLLAPAVLAAQPVACAHGDDHQGNIWVMDGPAGTGLRLFDPAFASDDMPALLAPVKATYHNVFAHPFWLYHPAEAAGRIAVTAQIDGDVVSVRDDAPVPALRRQILDSAAEHVWAPLLAALAERGELPRNWRAIVRSALFCCPLLVTNLISPARPAPVRLLGLARAVMAGSEPLDGDDPVSRFLDAVTPS
jgi:hypothetical protein